jgi:hypothetical protein
MYSAFADVKGHNSSASNWYQTYQNDMIRSRPESQLNFTFGAMPPIAVGAQAAPPHGYRQTFLGSIRPSPVHTEDKGM